MRRIASIVIGLTACVSACRDFGQAVRDCVAQGRCMDGGGLQVFCADPFFGVRTNYTELTPSRWSVRDDLGDAGYALDTPGSGAAAGLGEYTLPTNRQYGDFVLEAVFRSPAALGADGGADVGFVFGYLGPARYEYVALDERRAKSAVFHYADGGAEELDGVPAPLVTDRAHHAVTLTRKGGIASLAVDGLVRLRAFSPSASGALGFGSVDDPAVFDDVRVGLPDAPDAGLVTVTITASEDTYAWSNEPDAGHDGDYLSVQRDMQVGFVKFPLGQVAGTVTDAKLWLRLNASNGDASVSAHGIDDSWSQQTLTWLNQPFPPLAPDLSSANVGRTFVWSSWNVTAWVEQRRGGGQVSLAVTSDSLTYNRFDDSVRAQLEVTFRP